ncbi:MAG: hypothetical protein U0905_06825 [Pirellulales bacterium]
MQQLKPFTTVGPLKKALDNGGRFYNFWAAAGDEVVTRGELAKAAGVFTADIQAFMYLQMSSQDLGEKDLQSVLNMLDEKLRKDYAKKRPPFVQPSQVDSGYKAGDSIIVTGFAREIGKQTKLVGFITVPVMVGKVFVPIMIPIQDMYQVLEIFDDEKKTKPCAIVCAPQKKNIELDGRVQIGGVLKKTEAQSKEQPPTHPVFLEAIFWMKRT